MKQIGHVAIRTFHASLPQSSCLSHPVVLGHSSQHLFWLFIIYRGKPFFNQCPQVGYITVTLGSWMTSSTGCPRWSKRTTAPLLLQLHCCSWAWRPHHMMDHADHVFSKLVHTLQDFHRCRWPTRSLKGSASCRGRASAQSTGRGTAQGSSLESWSYPCSPPRRWNPEGSSRWYHPDPPGMWEEVVSVVVVGCGHPETSVRKELRTASAPAPALMKPFWSMSSSPAVRCSFFKCNVWSGKHTRLLMYSWERINDNYAQFKRRHNSWHPFL